MTMDLADRLLMLLIGGCIGYILARIVDYLKDIKEEVDEVLEIERYRNERGITRLRTVVMDLILGGVILMVAYSAYTVNQTNDRVMEDAENDKRSLCSAGAEARDIDRRLVEAVYGLATDAIDRPNDAPPLTPAELERVNSYIDKVNAFRENMYEQIKPSEFCEEYVVDDNVTPPPPRYPYLKP